MASYIDQSQSERRWPPPPPPFLSPSQCRPPATPGVRTTRLAEDRGRTARGAYLIKRRERTRRRRKTNHASFHLAAAEVATPLPPPAAAEAAAAAAASTKSHHRRQSLAYSVSRLHCHTSPPTVTAQIPFFHQSPKPLVRLFATKHMHPSCYAVLRKQKRGRYRDLYSPILIQLI